MAESELAKKLKKEFIDMPSNLYEPLTFGELKTGDMYIALPIPGDNKGHGGFRGTHNLFQKIQILKNLPEDSEEYGKNAYRLFQGKMVTVPDEMHVIKVQ